MDIPSYQALQSEMSRRHLFEFVLVNHHDYRAGWFNQTLCDELEIFYADVIAGKSPKLMIEAPPRHGKTEVASRMFPAWTFGKNPNLHIIATSYASSLAERNCRDVQKIMEADTYTRAFPHSSLSKTSIRTTLGSALRNSEMFEIVGHRGDYRAAGVGGGITGMGFDIGIIDDPFKDHEEAYSSTIREKVWHWYLTTFSTRASPRSGILIINTRWHDDDLCGRLLEKEPNDWKVLKFKAIATEDEPRRKQGEALQEDRYSVQTLRKFEQSLGPAFFAAMFQQTPIPASGSLFKTEMFEFATMPLEFDYSFITADTAYKDKQENDYTVFAAWGVKNGELYLRDLYRKQINSSEIEGPAMVFIRQFMHDGFRGAYIEPKGHGIYLNQSLPKQGITMPSESQLKEFYSDRTKNKVERANNAIPYLSHRKIHINKDIHERDEILKEVLSFPKAKHDDITDVFIDGIKFVFARKLSILDVL